MRVARGCDTLTDMHRRATVRPPLLALLGSVGLSLGLLVGGCSDDSPPDDREAGAGSSGNGASGGSSSGASPGSSSGSSGTGGTSDAGSACTTDLDCNGDPEVSSMQGECGLGICVCRDPFVVQPSGQCGAAPAPDCTEQNGACTQDPASCAAGQMVSTSLVNQSCGDFAPAVCCFDAAGCQGPRFRCVVPDETLTDALCVNGWRTCAAGARPMASGEP